jgi:hypothetical protein
MRLSLERPSTGDQIHDQDYERDYQEKVNQVSAEGENETSQQPNNQNHNKDSPEHSFLWVEFLLLRASTDWCA